MELLTWVGIAVTAAILSLTLKPYQPIFAFLTALAAGLCLLTAAAQAVWQLSGPVTNLASAAGISDSIYLPVIKVVGIATVIRIAGAICKDAGQDALAVKLELVGGIAALVACFPLIDELVALVNSILQ